MTLQKLPEDDRSNGLTAIDVIMTIAVTIILASILISQGCAGPARRTFAGPPPTRVYIPPQGPRPEVEINIYENGDVTTNGAARIKNHPHGLEVQPITPVPPGPEPKEQQEARPEHSWFPMPSLKPLPDHRIAAPPPSGPPTDMPDEVPIDGRGPMFSPHGYRLIMIAGSCLGVIGVVACLAWIFKRPLKETIAHADLSDGIGQELKEFTSKAGQQLKQGMHVSDVERALEKHLEQAKQDFLQKLKPSVTAPPGADAVAVRPPAATPAPAAPVTEPVVLAPHP